MPVLRISRRLLHPRLDPLTLLHTSQNSIWPTQTLSPTERLPLVTPSTPACDCYRQHNTVECHSRECHRSRVRYSSLEVLAGMVHLWYSLFAVCAPGPYQGPRHDSDKRVGVPSDAADPAPSHIPMFNTSVWPPPTLANRGCLRLRQPPH